MDYNITNRTTTIVSSPQFDLRIGWTESIGGKDIQFASHYDHIEIYIIKQGNCILETSNKTYKLTKDEFAIISLNEPHKISQISDDFSRITVGIYKINKNNDYAFDILSNKAKHKNVYDVSENMKHCIEYICSYLKNEFDNYLSAIEFIKIAFIYEVLNITNAKLSNSSKNIYNDNNKKIAEAKIFIEKMQP